MPAKMTLLLDLFFHTKSLISLLLILEIDCEERVVVIHGHADAHDLLQLGPHLVGEVCAPAVLGDVPLEESPAEAEGKNGLVVSLPKQRDYLSLILR